MSEIDWPQKEKGGGVALSAKKNEPMCEQRVFFGVIIFYYFQKNCWIVQ